MTEEEVRKRWNPRATAKLNEKFLFIEAYSGYSLKFIDFESTPYLLPLHVSYDELGQAVVKTLRNSRFLPLQKAIDLESKVECFYKQSIQTLIERYQYKTKRALFKNMKSCDLRIKDNVIIIEPMWHEKLEAWSGDKISKDDYVYIPVDSPPEEIGIALRLAFSRCK